MNPDVAQALTGEATFAARNDVVRIEWFDSLDEHLASALRTFCRLLDVPHVFEERIEPAMTTDSARLCVAMRDRPWPPWGLGGRKIAAVCQVQPIGESLYGLSPMFVADEDLTNIGLVAVVIKETLEEIAREQDAEVSYLVLDGSVLSHRVLESAGFAKTDDAVVTETARYSFYRGSAQKVLDELGLSSISTPELLAHEIPDTTYDRIAFLHSALYLAGSPRRWDDVLAREIIAINGGLFSAGLPGGPPPGPSSRGPDPDRFREDEFEEIEIDEDGIREVEIERVIEEEEADG
jgi:hypothetical protein